MATATLPEQAPQEIRLDLEGMTCASCASRIEKKLNRLDGVEATVNYATEQATVHAEPGISVEDLVGAVKSVGYGARVASPAHAGHAADGSGDHAEHRHD